MALSDGLDLVKVLWEHEPQADDELRLIPGQIITVIDRPDDGWWIGEKNGIVGLFPVSYCQPYIKEEDKEISSPELKEEEEEEEEFDSINLITPQYVPMPSDPFQTEILNPLTSLYSPNTLYQDKKDTLASLLGEDEESLDLTQLHLGVKVEAYSQEEEEEYNDDMEGLLQDQMSPNSFDDDDDDDDDDKYFDQGLLENHKQNYNEDLNISSTKPISYFQEVEGNLNEEEILTNDLLLNQIDRHFELKNPIPNFNMGSIRPRLPRKTSHASSLVLDRRSILDLEINHIKDEDDDVMDYLKLDDNLIQSNSLISTNGSNFEVSDGGVLAESLLPLTTKYGKLKCKCSITDTLSPLTQTKHWKQFTIYLIQNILLIFKLNLTPSPLKLKGYFDLNNGKIRSADKKESKKNGVFAIEMKSGSIPLFMSDDDDDDNKDWINKINFNINQNFDLLNDDKTIKSLIDGFGKEKIKEKDKNKEKDKIVKKKEGLTRMSSFKNKSKNLKYEERSLLDDPKSPDSTSSPEGEMVLLMGSKPKNNTKLIGKFFHKSSTSIDLKKEKNKSKKDKSNENIWINLSSSDDGISFIVKICITELELRKGYESQGVYRLSGNSSDIKKWKDKFINNGPISLTKEPDVNVICGVLKLYFRELNPPLIPFHQYEEFIEAAKIINYDTRLLQLHKVLLTLPYKNYQTLKYLINHLKLITQYSEINLMDPNNLAIVFGPTIARPKDEKVHPQLQPLYLLVESFIVQFDWFFLDEDQEIN